MSFDLEFADLTGRSAYLSQFGRGRVSLDRSISPLGVFGPLIHQPACTLNCMINLCKKFLVVVSSFAVFALGLSLGIPTVHAVGSGYATTGVATDVGANSANLNGVVTPTGRSYTYVFALGKASDLSSPVYTYSGSYSSNMTFYIRGSVHDAGTGPIVSQNSNFNIDQWKDPNGTEFLLSPSTTYYFRAGIQDGPDNPNCLWSVECYSWGSIATFTTRAATLPTVNTGPASLVGAHTAQISGDVISNDASASVSVEYGKSKDLSGTTQTESGRASDIMNQCYGSDCEMAPVSTTARAITRNLSGLDSETLYYYRVVARNAYGTVRGEIKSFSTTPPVGITINSGANYTTSKTVELAISWPVGATGMAISNDGGFRSGSVTNTTLSASYSWTIDDSVQGAYGKIIYVRFSGPGIDSSRSYSDDIIFDNMAPTVATSTAEQAGAYIALTFVAVDEVSGLSKIEINNVDKTVNADYAAMVLVKASDIGLGVTSTSVRKSSLGSLRIRISDKAGNKTSWITLGKSAVPVVVSASQLTTSKTATSKAIATYAKLKVSSTSKVTLRVLPSSAKFCRVFGSTLKGLKAGSCRVTVTVTQKKGRASFKTVTLKIAK